MTDSSDSGGNGIQIELDEINASKSIDILIFRACIGALWVDGVMAAAERDHLSHLIDNIATSEENREDLRRLALHDINRHELWSDIEGLSRDEKLHLFDRCVSCLTSDRRVKRSELRFLNQLRKRCGIGFWRFQRFVWRLTRVRWLLLILLVALVIAAIAIVANRTSVDVELLPPTELAEYRAVSLPRAPEQRRLLDPETLFQQVRRSVVTVNVTIDDTRHGHGSGTVIAADEAGQLYVLTNRHVIYHELLGGRQLTFDIELEGGVRLPAILDFYSRSQDLALLVVPGIAGWALPIPLLSKEHLRVGQQVYAIGSPIGLDDSFTSGVISALRAEYIQTDATVHSGSSGGPLFDASGLVCGVITTTHQQKDFSFAIYADLVFEMLAERRARKGG